MTLDPLTPREPIVRARSLIGNEEFPGCAGETDWLIEETLQCRQP